MRLGLVLDYLLKQSMFIWSGSFGETNRIVDRIACSYLYDHINTFCTDNLDDIYL